MTDHTLDHFVKKSKRPQTLDSDPSRVPTEVYPEPAVEEPVKEESPDQETVPQQETADEKLSKLIAELIEAHVRSVGTNLVFLE